jgi:hypothetical protein
LAWVSIVNFGNFGDFGNLSAPLCLRLSARTPPGIDVLLQTKGELNFDRAVTERSKLFSADYRVPICFIADPILMILLPLSAEGYRFDSAGSQKLKAKGCFSQFSMIVGTAIS